MIKNREKLLEILLLLKQIIAENITTPVHSPYHYLLNKVVLYILDAIISRSPVAEIDKFFLTANLVMTPNKELGNAVNLSSFMEMVPKSLRSAIVLKNQSGLNERFTICFEVLNEITSKKYSDDVLFKFLVVFLLEAQPNHYKPTSCSLAKDSLARNTSNLFSTSSPVNSTREHITPTQTAKIDA